MLDWRPYLGEGGGREWCYNVTSPTNIGNGLGGDNSGS